MKLFTRYRALADYAGLLAVMVALCAFFSVTTNSFFSASTFITVANQYADATVLAVGMTFVLLVGGIDLSVGSVLALCGAVLGVCLTQWEWPLPAAIALCLAVGMTCGLVNGLIVVGWNIPSFIVTLGMMQVARGLAFLATGSHTQYIGGSIEVVTGVSWLSLGLPFWSALILVAAGQTVVSGTAYGRHLMAVGANEESARLSGVRSRWVRLSVFIVSGVMAGVAAVIYTARLGAADPNAGAGYELQAIAAAVIGGTSLMGGRGSVVSSLLGVLIIAVLAYGLTQMSTPDPAKSVVTGCVIVVAVIVDYYRHRLGAASTRLG